MRMLVSGEAMLGIAPVELDLVIVPGPSMIYLVSRSIAQGRRAGLKGRVRFRLGKPNRGIGSARVAPALLV